MPPPIFSPVTASRENEPIPEATAKSFSLITRLALIALFWLGVSAVFALQISALGFLPWSTALTLALLDWGPWIFFSPVVLLLAERMPITPKTWRWAVPAHLVACIFVVALIETTMSSLSLRRDILAPHPGGPRQEMREKPRAGVAEEDRERPPRPPFDPVRFAWFRFFDRARFAVPIYWMLVAGAHAIAQQRRSVERERRALRAEALLAEARLMALQSQLNPHFLFNTLNTITQLVYENPEAAEEMITSLSELLRAVLAAQHRREVTLDEEIELLERYCAIQKVRFSDRLNVQYDIEPSTTNIAVPTLLLQPLVENAIKHGVTPDRSPGWVYIRAYAKDQKLCIEIVDTGGRPSGAPDEAGQKLEFREGVGLANTRARLATLYPGRHVFSLERAAEGGVLVKIEIPLRRISS
jgi:signal transduction histidine kinase